jgi:cytochrome P450
MVEATRSRIDPVGVDGQSCPHVATTTPEFVNNYYEVMAQARAESPVCWDDTYQRWFVLGSETLASVARDWESFTSADGVAGPESPLRLLPIESDPPLHTQWREILNPLFSVKAIEPMQAGIRALALGLLDRLPSEGSAELVRAFTTPFPGMVFFQQILGEGEEELARCTHLVEIALDAEHPETQADGYRGLFQYAHTLITSARENPETRNRGTVIDAVAFAQIDGEPAPLQDAVSVLTMLILGGLETTTNTLSNVFHYLAEHPDSRRQLQGDRSLLHTAVEEFLRLYSPATYLLRRATRDTEIEGTRIRQGQWVALGFSGAARDPKAYTQPDEFLLDREHHRHVTFGIGLHRCLGSNLARLMMRQALEAFLDVFDEVSPVDGFAPEYRVTGVRSLVRLDVNYAKKKRA